MSDDNGMRRARVRVRYADTDQMGVTYHANYLVWFEVGRTDWLRGVGLDLSRHGSARASRCRSSRCSASTTSRPATTTKSRSGRGRRSSRPVRIRFDYEVVRLADGTAAASGHSVHAALNAAGTPLPAAGARARDARTGPAGQPGDARPSTIEARWLH